MFLSISAICAVKMHEYHKDALEIMQHIKRNVRCKIKADRY